MAREGQQERQKEDAVPNKKLNAETVSTFLDERN